MWLAAEWVVFSANERSGARSVDGEPNVEWTAAGHRNCGVYVQRGDDQVFAVLRTAAD